MIDIKELKNSIENKTYNYPLVIFLMSTKESVSFLCNQYVNEILSQKTDAIKMDNVNSVIACRQDIFSPSNEFIYCRLEEFDVKTDILTKYSNILIVCDKMSADAKSIYKDYVVEFPELEKWHIRDYVVSRCNLSNDNTDYLIEKCESIYRLSNELDKIAIFEKNAQKYIFNDLCSDNFLSDSNDYDIFNLANPIINKAYGDLVGAWKEVKLFDSDPMLLLSVLINQYKTIIDVFLYPNSTPEICGISQKRFNAIKYYCKNYTKKQLVEVYKFLTSVDADLKNGKLPNEDLLDYIIIITIQKGNS